MSEVDAQKWLSIRDISLPAHPYFHQEAIDLLNRGYSKAAQLAEIISHDPGMCLSLFYKINAKRIISSRPFVNNIQSATSFFSEIAIDDFVRQHPIFDTEFQKSTKFIAYQQILSRSLFVSLLLQNWAEAQGSSITSELKMAGVLHNLGEMTVCLGEFEKYQQFNRQQLEKGYSSKIVRQHFTFDFNQLGKQQVKKWALPELIDETLSAQKQNRNTRMVQLAAEISRQAQQGWDHKAILNSLETAAEFLDYSLDKLSIQVHQIAVQAARAFPIAEVDHVARRLVHLPRTTAENLVIHPIPHVAKITKVKLPSLMDTIKKLAKNPATTQSQILNQLINGLKQEQQFSTISLMMLSPDKSIIQSRVCLGMGMKNAFSRLQLKTQQAGLFKAFLKKTQALWVNSGNYKKYNALIPGQFKATILTENFFIMSMFIDNKPVGIIYADRTGISQKPLDTKTFTQFKANIFLASKALAVITEKHRLTPAPITKASISRTPIPQAQNISAQQVRKSG